LWSRRLRTRTTCSRSTMSYGRREQIKASASRTRRSSSVLAMMARSKFGRLTLDSFNLQQAQLRHRAAPLFSAILTCSPITLAASTALATFSKGGLDSSSVTTSGWSSLAQTGACTEFSIGFGRWFRQRESGRVVDSPLGWRALLDACQFCAWWPYGRSSDGSLSKARSAKIVEGSSTWTNKRLPMYKRHVRSTDVSERVLYERQRLDMVRRGANGVRLMSRHSHKERSQVAAWRRYASTATLEILRGCA